jgi:predicted ArsR family transcriptional regulator
MILSVLRDILNTPVMDIILHLKQSPGMTIKELAASMKMSYMGVKQHCDALAKKGYLDTWRQPVPHGRPEKIYLVTAKLDPLFPTATTENLMEILDHAERLFGANAPQKLLYAFFASKAEHYAKKVNVETELENKALTLSRLRSVDGTLSIIEMSASGDLRMVDYHSPYGELLKKYPLMAEIESEMMEKLLGCTVTRREEEQRGHHRVIFFLSRSEV